MLTNRVCKLIKSLTLVEILRSELGDCFIVGNGISRGVIGRWADVVGVFMQPVGTHVLITRGN